MKRRSISAIRTSAVALSSTIWDSKAHFKHDIRAKRLSVDPVSEEFDQLMHERVVARKLPQSYKQSPDDLFDAVKLNSAEVRENIFKNRIVKDEKRLFEKDTEIRTYRSIIAYLISDREASLDIAIDRLKRLPKLGDELDLVLTQQLSPKASEDADMDLVMQSMPIKLNSLKPQRASLKSFNTDRTKLNISLIKKTSKEGTNRRLMTYRTSGDSSNLAYIKRKKFVDLIGFIAGTYLTTESSGGLWELDYKVLEFLKADKAHLFKLDRSKGSFKTSIRGVTQMLSVKNSLLTVAFTQKQILQVPDTDISFDNKINALFGGFARQMDLLPILDSTNSPTAVIVVLRQTYASMSSELNLIAPILGASYELKDLKKSSELHKRSMDLTLRACEQLYQISDLYEFALVAAELFKELMKAERAQLLLVNYDKGEIFRRVRMPNDPFGLESYPLSCGISGYSATKRTHVITNDLHNHKFYAAEVDDPANLSRSFMSVPLPKDKKVQVQAVLTVADKLDGTDFTDDDFNLMELYGSVIIRIGDSAQIREDFHWMKITCKKIIEMTQEFSSNYNPHSLSHLKRLLNSMESLRSIK